MKRMFLATSVALPCLIVVGMSCSADDSAFQPMPTTAGGTAGSATTSTTTTATSGTGNGGSNSVTSTTMTSTATTSTGAAGSGAATTTTGSGGAAGGTGAGGSGGSGTGAGGANVDGGGTGGSGTGGAGGAGGASGICTADGDCTAVLKTAGGKPMDGWANIDPPASTTAPDGHQGPSMIDNVASSAMTAGIPCQQTEMQGGRPLKVAHWQLMGPGITMGQNYAVTIHFWGVVECKNYWPASLTNCPKENSAGRGLTTTHDFWCPGATDPPPGQPTDHYNTNMLSVTPTSSANTPNMGGPGGVAPTAGNWWMLNQCPQQQTSEFHLTWKIDYEKTITVPGGSWINYTEYDTNCLEIINCGDSSDAAGVCNNHYTFTGFPGAIPAPDPALALTGTVAGASGVGGFGQWIYFDVRSIKPM